MKYPKCVLSAAIILAGILLGVLLQSDLFFVYLWVFMGLVIVVPVTLGTGLVAIIMAALGRSMGSKMRLVLAIGCSLVVSLLAGGATGSLIDKWKVEAVRSYVARAVPVLDAIAKREGAYPTTLPVRLVGEPPELLKNFGNYSATPATFRFEYVNEPAGWAGDGGAIAFDSATRKWTDDR